MSDRISIDAEAFAASGQTLQGKVSLQDLDARSHSPDIADLAAAVSYSLDAGRDDWDRIRLRLRLAGSLKLCCQRCLQPFDFELDETAQVVLFADEEALARIRSEHIGFVFPGENLLPHQTARQNIELPMRMRGEKADEGWYSSVVRTMGIAGVMDELPSRLPRAMQQRVAVARAILGRPAIILADDPAHSLDSRASLEIVELLRLCVREFGQTVLMATQDLAEAALAERVILFSDGGVAGEISEPTPVSILTALEALSLRSGPG